LNQEKEVVKVVSVDKIRGGLYGLACGDALGATVEFMSKAEIKNSYGMLRDIIGGGWLNLRPGDWTDDTEMTLAVAEGIIGSTIRAVFHTYDRVKDWHKAAEQVHNYHGMTAGNGALMRTLPLAFAYKDTEVLYISCIEVARMTHWDPEAGLTCYLYCLTAQSCFKGLEFLEAYNNALTLLQELNPAGEIGDAAKGLVDKFTKVTSWSEKALKPTGYTVDTLSCALWCVATTTTFEQAVVKAVNLGGDADTVGAVAGGLAGIIYGYEGIPARWIGKFGDWQNKRLENVVEALMRL
jgi:ADP-ribosyl-[dinitrogen reductase] hydrolase